MATTFSGEGGRLSCDDCHDPHDKQTVEPFLGDRMRVSGDTTSFMSNRLLKQQPTPDATPVGTYGSDWCAACHRGRLPHIGTLNNHPVDATGTTDFFYYDRVASVTSTSSIATTLSPLGRSNLGYVMPYPRTSEQSGHAPICQQCHEDQRSVGTSGAATEFTVTSPDGAAAGDNPRFLDFPHESPAPSLNVETGDDLCTNCHPS